MTVKHNLSTKMSDKEKDELDASTTTEDELDLDNLDEEEDEDTEESEDPAVLKEQLKKANDAKALILKRAKSAEHKLKLATKPATETPADKKEDQTTQSLVDVDERILKANGIDPDLLKELKAVAQLRNVSLIDAQNDPLYVAIKEKFEKDKKSQEGSLPASKGSGTRKAGKSLDTPGLTREEHQALAKKLMTE